ncbi:hypothetical protein ACFYWX_43425 [Streptomyces sp. NPDC002888]|uniref:hypothetical protein n=1 Tax=Streptomyces sp. NPDC002888 TaxID=3364668 RepID=UPI0036917D54
MTGMTVFSFVLIGLLVVMGCLKADRVRAWRRSVNPSAPELPDGFFVVTRIALFGLAGVGLFTTFQLMATADNSEWSEDESAGAVSGATTALDGSSRYGDLYGDDSGFDGEYARMIEDEVQEHGGGDAPGFGVDAVPADTNKASDARYTVTASGAGVAFCLHVERTRSKEDDWDAPGVAGGEGTVTVPSYRFAVTSRKGAC